MTHRRLALAGLALLLAGCLGTATPPATPTSGARRAPPKAAGRLPALPGTPTRVVAQVGALDRLVGKVKLLSDLGGTVISNGSAGIVSNGGAGVVSNGGGSLAEGPRPLRTLTQARRTEALLADAPVLVLDGAGRVLVDEGGRPLGTTTDAAGAYRLEAVLPDETLVLRVPLPDGGQLSALVPRTEARERQVAVDTASTLGSAYVLGRFVQGSQAVLDRLPAQEAEQLRNDLEAARDMLERVPTYRDGDMLAIVEQLRGRAPAVDRTLEAIKARLIGQANLGAGKPALEVPLTGPFGTAEDGVGGFFVTEKALGRIRHVSSDGIVTTWADGLQGRVQANFPGVEDIVRAPDGSVYLGVTVARGYVVRIAPDMTWARVAGAVAGGKATLGGPALESALAPRTLWLDPGGALWIGEASAPGGVPRVMRLTGDGRLQAAGKPPEAWRDAAVDGLTAAPDGATWALLTGDDDVAGLWRLGPEDATWTEVTSWPAADGTPSDICTAPDGTVYMSGKRAGRIWRVAADGTREEVWRARPGEGLQMPGDLAPLPDGRLRIVSNAENRVFELTPGGEAVAVAGMASGGSTASQIVVNGPFAVALDAAAQLHIAEAGGHQVLRWDGTALVRVAGSTRGWAGDKGPALAAQLDAPSGIAFRDGSMYILDQGNSSLREVTPDGLIQRRVGGEEPRTIAPGEAVDALEYSTYQHTGLRLGPQGDMLWCAPRQGQVVRLDRETGRVVLVAGRGRGRAAETDGMAAAETDLRFPMSVAVAPDGELVIADTGASRVYRGTPARLRTVAGLGPAATREAVASGLPVRSPETAREAPLVAPGALCFAPDGTMYVADLGTRQFGLLRLMLDGVEQLEQALLPPLPARICKVSPDGRFSVVAGPGSQVWPDPDAGDALVLPTDLAIDGEGRLVIVDAGASLVRVLPAGSY